MATKMSAFANEYAKAHGLLNAGSEKAKRNKFGAKKTQIGGDTFDSKVEARFSQRLSMLKRAGEIAAVELQPSFLLNEAFRDNRGVDHAAIYYKADFRVVFKDGAEKIYDTKGVKTEVYRIKKKLLLSRYPNINFEEVFDADEHPVTSKILPIETIKAIEKKAIAKTDLWKSKHSVSK